MISSWPPRTRDLTDRLFASARSVRLTFSLRAIVASDSPLRPCTTSARSCPPAPASARRAWNCVAGPGRHLQLEVGYFTGVVQRRSSGLSAWISSIDVPVHSATRRRSIARGTVTLS